MEDPTEYPENTSLPILSKLRHWWRTRPNRCRRAESLEYDIDYSESSNEIEISIFAPRRVIGIGLNVATKIPFTVETLRYADEDEWVAMPVGVKYDYHKEEIRTQISLRNPILTARIRISLKGSIESRYMIVLAIGKDEYEDEDLLLDGMESLNNDAFTDANDKLSKYLLMAPENGHALRGIAIARWKLKEYGSAERYAVKAAARGQEEDGSTIYRVIQDERPYYTTDAIQELQENSKLWKIDGYHGIVELQKEATFQLGLDGWYVRKRHSILEVRREAAGRMFRRLDFAFTSNDALLHTRLRIVHPDGATEELSADKFTKSESPKRNVFIESRVELLGTWMLPDLHVGDLIEFEFSVAQRYTSPNGSDIELFIVTLLNHNIFPTFQSRLEFIAPSNWDIKFVGTNGAPGRPGLEDLDDEITVYRFSGDRYSPLTETGYHWEEHTLNPVVACSVSTRGWQAVLSDTVKSQVGVELTDDPLPEPLVSIVNEPIESVMRLQKVFYWLRDKLKYGSFNASRECIGAADRLKIIVESGYADCKDRAFVLRQVCHTLKIPCHYMLVNTNEGVLYEDLPADQFNHVFLAIRHNDSWLYLDATNDGNSFGLPPIEFQGMHALSDINGVKVVPISTDLPETNRIEIRESFDKATGSWLSGEFDIRAFGRSARTIDERWKVFSLRHHDYVQTITMALSGNMPRIIPDTAEKTSHTGHSECFAAHGKHRRCQLSKMNGRLVGTLTWDEESLPLQHWRYIHSRRFVAFKMPIELVLSCVLTGEARSRLESVSEPQTFSNELCDINGELSYTDKSVTHFTRIVVKALFVSSEQQSLLPPTMEAIERAMRLAVVFAD